MRPRPEPGCIVMGHPPRDPNHRTVAMARFNLTHA